MTHFSLKEGSRGNYLPKILESWGYRKKRDKYSA